MSFPQEFRRLLFNEFFEVKEKQITSEFKYWGNNTARVLHVLENESVEQIPADEMSLLEQIIRKATLLEPENCALLPIGNLTQVRIQELLDTFKPAKIFIWGCEDWNTKEFQLKPYEIKKWGNAFVLKAESLFVYPSDALKKKQLWEQIKKLNKAIG